jgi:hypothetical protein
MVANILPLELRGKFRPGPGNRVRFGTHKLIAWCRDNVQTEVPRSLLELDAAVQGDEQTSSQSATVV